MFFNLETSTTFDYISKWQEGIKYLDEVLKKNPSHMGALYYKAQALSNQDHFGEAEQLFNQILNQVDPGTKFYAEVLVSKGTTIMELKKLEEADHCFDKALEIKPELARAWLHKGRIAARRKDYQVSITYCDRAIALNPKDARGWNNKAFALYQLNKPDDCILCARRAVEIQPRYYMAWLWLSKAYEVKGDIRRAKMCYDNFQKNIGFTGNS